VLPVDVLLLYDKFPTNCKRILTKCWEYFIIVLLQIGLKPQIWEFDLADLEDGSGLKYEADTHALLSQN
jgi:hypothetical protein